MRIDHTVPPDGFVRVPNESIRDDRLSLRARGLLALLLSHKDGYEVTADDVARQTSEGRNAVRAAMRELESAGYLRRDRVRGEGGRWMIALTLSAMPAVSPDVVGQSPRPAYRIPGAGQPGAGRPAAGEPGVNQEDQREEQPEEQEKDQRTSDDDLARAREDDPNVDNSNHRADPTPPGPIKASAAEDDPPDPRSPLPTGGTSPAGPTTGTERAEGLPIPSPAGGPWMLTAESLVDREVVGFGVELDSTARGQLVMAVAGRLAAGVEPGALAEELGGELPPGADPVTVLLDCVRQTRPPGDVRQADAVDGVTGDDSTAGAQMTTYGGRTSSLAHGDQTAAGVDLVQALIDAVHEVTGQTIDRDLAGKGVAMVLRAKDGSPRAVSDPVAYLRTAVETAPARFLPSVIPPRVGGRESKAAQRARGFDELRAWAAEASDGGQRLDNTGTVVITQDGQAAGTAPAEPLSDPWATGTTPVGWMAAPVRQRAPEPHMCRYGCRPGQHTYEDPETGVPTRCPIHHEHARHREAA